MLANPSDALPSSESGNITPGSLFRLFLAIGASSFGMSMLESLRRAVIRYGLISEEELREGLAMVQLYPGPMMFDLVAFIGYRRRGTLGALAAAGGFILPATLMMLAVAWFYEQFGDVPLVRVLSVGLGAAVVGAVAHVMLEFAKKNLSDAVTWGISACAFAAAVAQVDSLSIIALGLLVGTGLCRTSGSPASDNQVHKRSASLAGPILVSAIVISAALIAVLTEGALAELTAVFLKIGATAFGNAATILPVMREAVVSQHAWITPVDFNAAIAFGNLTPGPVLNSATFIGYRLAGLAGGLAATLAVFAPSFAMTLFFTEFFARVRHLALGRSAIRGVLAVFVGLLASTILFMASPLLARPSALLIGLLAFALLRLTKLHIALVFLISVVAWSAWALM